MRFLTQNTARTIMVFLVSSVDHISGLSGQAASLTITESKNGGAFSSITPTVSDLGNGWYSIALTATNTNTAGDYALYITCAGADPIKEIFNVQASLPSNVISIGANAITSSAIAANAITSAKIAANAITSSQIASGAIGSSQLADSAITASKISDGAIDLASLAADVIPKIVDEVWDEAIADHIIVGSTGEALDGAFSGANPAAVASAVWNESRAPHTDPGTFGEGVNVALVNTDALTDNSVAVTAVTKIQSGLATSVNLSTLQSTVDIISTRIGSPTGASIAVDIASVLSRIGSPVGASISNDISSIKLDTSSISASLTSVGNQISSLHKVTFGRWKIEGNVLTLYDNDDVTPLQTFNLLDDTGAPSGTRIFERIPT